VPEVTGDHEAIAQLAGTLDALDEKIRANESTIKRSEHNRLSLLHVHAVFACFIGPLFTALGQHGMAAPAWVLIRQIPGTPWSLGAILFIGGVILGAATWFRHLRWEIVGLWILMAWYATIAIGFGGAVFVWLAAGRPPGAQPSYYPAGVYAHVLVILSVHQRTLLRMRRARRAHR
jgi:hypothetical protein